MTINSRAIRSIGVIGGLTVALLAGCMLPAHEWRPAPPVPCDSTYLALKQQHPDSLSEREWQRFQILDHECANVRVPETRRETSEPVHGGWLGMRHTPTVIGATVMAALMTAMMIRMW